MVSKKQHPHFDFELALEELNKLVEKMERGGLPLEESLKDFERGISLTRQCQQALKDAEQKVQILIKNSAESELSVYVEEKD